jgi:uncharacterized protein (TIGR03086 family)
MGDTVELYRAAAGRAVELVDAVGAGQWDGPTPCAEWDVRELVAHLVGGTEYLRSAMAGRSPEPVPAGDDPAAGYRSRVAATLAEASAPGALDRTCVSPLGFEWTVAEAFAGTFLDTLVHSWDLAVATGQDRTLAPDLVDACIAMFLPDMPERGRQAGLVGPPVDVGPDPSSQDRLLGAMGRRP